MARVKPQISLWLIVFGLTAGLQIFRGSTDDTIFFVFSTLAVLLSGTALIRFDFLSTKHVSDNALKWAALALAIGLTVLPRHTQAGLVLFLCLLPASLLMVWGNHRGPKGKPSQRVLRSRLAWIIWAVVTCVWEFAANILGQVLKDPHGYPTISLLIDPLMDQIIGQAGYVVVWVAVGYGLIKVARSE